jgi:curved DNA-binding protein CbpA
MVLQVAHDAALGLIVQAYRRLALKLHPDRSPERTAAGDFQLVSKCLPLLTIVESRALILKLEARESL